jgi:UDP-glucose 4-epimerase
MDSVWRQETQNIVIGDILDQDLLNHEISKSYAVYNFAAVADLDEALKKPIETVEINILGNVKILEACRKNNIGRYIYASSVYVKSREGGFYSCSKNAAEQYIYEYNKRFNLNYTILRYGSLYGPRSDSHNGLWRIVNKAIESGKISYSGSPEAMREYIHVLDAAKSSVEALDDDFLNQTLIISGQEPMKIIDLLHILSEIIDFKCEIEFENNTNLGHYVRTSYAFRQDIARKYIPKFHIDLGHGLLDLISEIKSNKK